VKGPGRLGSFQEDNLAQDNARAWFWQGARKRLDQLGICGRITSRDREKIEAALAQPIPITSEQEIADNREAQESWLNGNGSTSANG
jgi:hypothetical protein